MSFNIRDLLQSCFVPELKENLDNIPLQPENFALYHKSLEIQLPILYDYVQLHEQLIFGKHENEMQEVHASIIVLLCELTGPHAVYKLENEYFLKNANRLLHRHTQLDDDVDQIIFKNYQSKLNEDCWKKQIGATHGFLRFLEFRYNEISRKTCKLSNNWLNFCVSFGLRLRECYEPIYKQFGIRIFHIILNYGNYEYIIEQNIHSVIYDAVFKDVHVMNTIVATADIWSCLIRCLDFFQDIDSLSWNQADDMMEVLLRNIPLAPDSLISICMLKFVAKLGAYFTINREDIEKKCNSDLNVLAELEACRYACLSNNSYISFRWAKNILNLFIIESYKMTQNINVCRQMLQEMHRCYMVCITPIPLKVAEPHLITFFEKFIVILMNIIVVQEQDANIVKLVKSVLETFYLQLQRDPNCDKCKKLITFRNAFEKLLKSDLFL